MGNNRNKFTEAFSDRLIKALNDKGLSSKTAKSGVKVAELAEIAGCSMTNARKYVSGKTLPDFHNVKKIAKWLDLDPGFLLFGEPITPPPSNNNMASHIDFELLDKIITDCTPLLLDKNDLKGVISFMINLFRKASSLSADRKDVFEMVDLAISSAISLNRDD